MPSPSKKSHGHDVQARVKSLLKALLDCVSGEQELGRGVELKWVWSDDEKVLTIETTLRSLVLLSQPTLKTNTPEFKRATAQVGEALHDLEDFVAILEDVRTQKRGSDRWLFLLRLWGKDIDLNLAEFDKLWESQRSPTSKLKSVPVSQPKSPLKAGAPFPRVRLPENFVERPDALNAVKAKLLAVDERTLVVSAIAGLGGLGKSVLAAALVQDLEVQARFADGILWATLGQSPDLQTLLGDWIRELDKSREAFSANTLESASRYLHNLLAERQMLLVVDDVWNAAHAEWFRVECEGCRVLVTTREAQIEGADTYSLALMSESEAIALVRQKLGTKWRSAQEVEVKAFAKLLGYLPLALDLATNQVRDGLSWEELRSEFEAERRSVASGIGRRSRALNLLDSSEKWDDLDENAQRKYSLQACFNLSLKRLTHQQLQQFAWLGVLPEDVNLNSRMAEVLWDLKPLQAKRVLILLRSRSFLTDGVATIAEEATYRVHDLMHDMARSLIEEGILSSEPVPLELAHRQFLERYRERTSNHRWDGLTDDGYIHRHLTWHLEQANWGDELHALMSMSDAKGRNAWFEACDRLGQPAIFVDDVARGWKIAERGYEGDRAGAIVWQCRYALITATLNSLVENLPIDMMAEFVKHGFWTVEQAWAYVEQMQDENKIAEAIQALAPYLSRSLFQVALQAAREIKSESRRASVLSELAKIDSAYFDEALQAAREIKAEYSRAMVLSELAKIDSTYFDEALQAAREIKDEDSWAWVLSELAKIDSAYFDEALQAAREIKAEYSRAMVLSELAKIDSAYFDVLLQAAREIKSKYNRARVLSELAKIDSAYFDEALQEVREIKSDDRAMVLSEIAKIDSAYLDEALQAAREIKAKSSRAGVLSELAKIDSAYFDEALQAAREINDEYSRAGVLSELAKIDSAYFDEALQTAREINDEYSRAMVLSEIAKIDSAYFDEALQAAMEIKAEYIRAWVLSELAKIDSAYFDEAL
ncbi:MAG: NB-ARC domain-containing protein, partial [Pseudanabaena sp.]